MKTLRFALSVFSIVALGVGYLASLVFSLTGRASEWATRIDNPTVSAFALLVLVAAVVLAFIPEKETE